MTYSVNLNKGHQSATQNGTLAPDSKALPTISVGELPGLASCLALARGVGLLLDQVKPPEDFQPQSPVIPRELTAAMIQALGTTNLIDFYTQALPLKTTKKLLACGRTQVAAVFPGGPESFTSVSRVIQAEMLRLQQAVKDLEHSWPAERPGLQEHLQPLVSRLTKFRESQQMLTQAHDLWLKLKAETEKWPDNINILDLKAKRLGEMVSPLLKTVREFISGGEGFFPKKINLAVVDLKAENKAARKIILARGRWSKNFNKLLPELDRLLPQAVKKSPPADQDQNREALAYKLSEKLTAMERQQQHLTDESLYCLLELSRSLATVAGFGKEIIEPIDKISNRVEAASQATSVLWYSTVHHRREIAQLYFTLPGLIGHPEFIENLFLGLGLSLGKIQSRLGDLRQRLSLAVKRLPDIKNLRTEAESLLVSLGSPLPLTEELKSARHRLASLLKTMGQGGTLSEVRNQLNQARRSGRETGQELNRGLVEIRKMRQELESTHSELKTLKEEKIRLKEQLRAARHGLGTVSQLRPKLLEKFAEKATLIKMFERDHWHKKVFLHKNTIHHLVSTRKLVRAQLREITRKLTTLEGAYHETGSHLTEVLGHNQELMAARQQLQDQLTETTLKIATLEAACQETSSRLAEAQSYTQETECQNLELTSAIGVLREEHQEMSNHLEEFDEERHSLVQRIIEMEEQRLKTSPTLSLSEHKNTRLENKDQQMKGDLAPFIQTLTAALWRSQALLKRARVATTRFRARTNLESEVREADSGLSASTWEMARPDNNHLKSLPVTKTEESILATETIQEMKSAQAAQIKMANHFKSRTAKMHVALNALHSRYRQHLTQTQATQDDLREFITHLMSGMINHGLEIEPLLVHFHEEAQKAFPEQDQMGHNLARVLLEDSLKLAQETTPDGPSPTKPQSLTQLQEQLREVQPVMAFLTKSFVEGVAQLARARQETSQLTDELNTLRQPPGSPPEEMGQLQHKTQDLTRQCDELKMTVTAKDSQINILKHELAQADQDLAENDGRLEASWAALNYLGTRTGDSISNLKERIDSQARLVDTMRQELKGRETQIKKLEDQQAKVALMYWTLISDTVPGQAKAPPPPAVPYSFSALSPSEKDSVLPEISPKTFVGSSPK